MTNASIPKAEEDLQQRFNVQLFIVHPTLDPADITAALGLQAHHEHRVGDPRRTPTGTPLLGTYQDTRWRHSIRHEVNDQRFADRVTDLVSRLASRRTFLSTIRAAGGQASLILQFFGDGYFGDRIPAETLAKLAELGLDFGIEVFTVPQS